MVNLIYNLIFSFFILDIPQARLMYEESHGHLKETEYPLMPIRIRVKGVLKPTMDKKASFLQSKSDKKGDDKYFLLLILMQSYCFSNGPEINAQFLIPMFLYTSGEHKNMKNSLE